ncbi:hypothetical protein AB0A73_21410 [Glycomyces sp. NPDC047369]
MTLLQHGRRLGTVAAGLLLAAFAAVPAHAHANPDACASDEHHGTGPVSPIDAGDLAQRTKALVGEGRIDLAATAPDYLAWQDANAYTWDQGSFLAVPAKKFTGDASSLSVFYGPDGEQTDVVEVFAEQRAGGVWVQVWRNGDRTLHSRVDTEKASAWWAEFEDCVAKHGGVSSTTAATLGTGCIVCLGAAGGIGASVLGWCAGKAMNG